MRTIKFRGKRLDNQEWEQGNYVVYKEDDGESVHCIVSRERNQIGASLDFVPVVPETVGEFSGLTDKNDKEIYENDICKFFNPYSKQWHVGLLKYHIGAFGFHKSLDDKYGFEWDFLAIKELEVIGSIHDNPELLKTK